MGFSISIIIQNKTRRIESPPIPSSSVAGQKRVVQGWGGGTGEDVEFWNVDQRPGEVKGNHGVFCAASQERGREKREGRASS